MRKIFLMLLLILFLPLFIFPSSVFADSFANEGNNVPASGECFTSDECRKMYESRAQDKENGKDYKAYIGSYKGNFLEGAWEEQEKLCGKEGFGYCYAPPPVVPLSVKIPGLGNSVQGLSQYISSLYKFGFYGASIMAVFIIMRAGYQRLIAMGNAEKIARSTDRIKRSVAALVILALSYTVLEAINPKLVSLSFKGPPLFRYIGLAGACLPQEGDANINVYGKTNTGSTAKFTIGSNGALIPDGILVKDANFPTCGVEFEPVDKNKYGPRCTGAFCPLGLECIALQDCKARIIVGRVQYLDTRTAESDRYINEVDIYRSSSSNNSEFMFQALIKKGKNSFELDPFSAGVLSNAELVSFLSNNELYKKLILDKDSPAGSEEEVRYYFKVILEENNGFDDDYYVDKDCLPFTASESKNSEYGGEPNRIMLFSRGVKSAGKSPFFTLNCTISDSIFPPD